MSNNKISRRLVSLTLLLTYALIVVGGATRVWDAGMSCPDWPTCYGVWWPFNLEHFTVNGRSYALFQVLLEWFHRLLAAVVGGLLLITMGFLFYDGQRRQRPAAPRAWPVAVLAVGVLLVQVKLGGITVWFNNIPWSVALHLGNAMVFLAVLVWLRRVVALAGPPGPRAGAPVFYAAFGLLSLTILATMTIGATVSSAYAGGVCGGLFACAEAWWPADALQQLHMLHRFAAVATFGVSLALLFAWMRTNSPQISEALSPAKGLFILVLIQIVIGIITLYSFGFYENNFLGQYYETFYKIMSVIHLAWGTLLFMASIGAMLNLSYGKSGRFHAKN
jgi:cytochrome c oxidase assembly protein subunit 15